MKMPNCDISSNCGPSSGCGRTNLAPFDASRWDDSNELKYIRPRLLGGPQFDEILPIRIFHLHLLCPIVFCWILRHSVLMEGRIYCHSTCLSETILMSYHSSFYDHWIRSIRSIRSIRRIIRRIRSSAGFHPDASVTWSSGWRIDRIHPDRTSNPTDKRDFEFSQVLCVCCHHNIKLHIGKWDLRK
jgi:hypothetical protein